MNIFSRCTICQRMLLPPEEARAVCEHCARSSGARALPPPRRRRGPCAKCNHTKLVRVVPRELDHGQGAPMFAAYRFPIEASTGAGMFEAYVCRACGFVEWYCHAPEQIPIGPEFMTEEIDLDATGPYR